MSLRARLTAVLLALFLAVAATLLVGVVRGSRLYFEEVHHKLNRDVAAHVVKSLHPFADGEVDQSVIKGLFMDVMHLNPSLEVYLLGVGGEVLAFDAPAGRVKLDRVGLGPLRATLARGEGAPMLRGDDPRNPDSKKPFSVAELRRDGDLHGYLYVILGGEAHEAVAASLRESAILRWSAVFVIGSAALAALAGALSIAVLVRPLRRLRDAMTEFREGERPRARDNSSRDEVGQLARAFHQMADRIADQMEELRRNDRRRREFVANISHDLRTPTGAIQGYLETLILRWNKLGAQEREQFLRTALRQSERLGKLVEQLFELTRLEAREFMPEKEVFSLAELVQDVVAKFQVAAERKSVILEAGFDYDTPPVAADIGLIERALDNLIDNAIRYSQPGGRVRVQLSQVPGGVGVSVSDSGPGIPDDQISRVFDRFYRVAPLDGETVRGAGLGLAITKRILDLHDGDIEVHSQENQGTTFSFVLSPAGSAVGTEVRTGN